MDFSLQNKNILITGGTSVLGQAFVKKAVAQKANIFFTYFKNESTAAELQKLGAKGFALDLVDMRAIDSVVDQIKKEIQALDIVIHNAAAIRDHTIQNMNEEDWDIVLTADLKAPYYLTKKLLPLIFKAVKKGDKATAKIFFITSRAAITGGFGISNYAAAKAGLLGLTKSLAQELGKKNILVNAVNPGFMLSAMTRDLPDEVKAKHLAASPVNRYSDPEEVADFLVYLSADVMTQLTGQILHFESRKT